MTRRFEFVQGTSAKFWSPSIEGTTFTVVYGRIGTEGQRKDKPFPSADAAQREYDKKVAEKLREGYVEVGAASAAPPPAAKAAAAPPPRPPLPPRVKAVPLEGPRLQKAAGALRELHKTLGAKHRSWRIAMLAQRARRALEGIAGADPAADGELASAFDQLMAQVVAPPTSRLPLRLAMPLLLELDTAAFGRAMELWQKHSAPPAVAVLTRQLTELADPELTLRLGALLCARPDREVGSESAWTRRWRALQPHLEAHLSGQGTTLKAYVGKIDTAGDAALATRVQKLR